MIILRQSGRVAEQVMVDIEENFATDKDIGIMQLAVCEKIKSKDYRAVCRVFKRDHTVGRGGRLHSTKNV